MKMCEVTKGAGVCGRHPITLSIINSLCIHRKCSKCLSSPINLNSSTQLIIKLKKLNHGN